MNFPLAKVRAFSQHSQYLHCPFITLGGSGNRSTASESVIYRVKAAGLG